MSSASLGQDFGRGQVGESGIGKKEVGGTSIHGLNPSMEIGEVRLDEGHKGISREGIKGVLDVKGNVNMGGVGVKECRYGMVGQLSAVTATDTYLDGPW